MNGDIRKFFKIGAGSAGSDVGGKGASSVKKIKKVSKKNSAKQWKVFTDGSTINNGKRNAKGGIGIFFEDDSEYKVGEPFSYKGKTSNNICELEAVRRAIEIVVKKPEYKTGDKILICTDSSYVIDCITKWSNTWEKNGWKRKNRSGKLQPVKNVDLIKSIKSMYYKYNVLFKHIKAHRNLSEEIKKSSLEYQEWYGNKMADELANIGSGK